MPRRGPEPRTAAASKKLKRFISAFHKVAYWLILWATYLTSQLISWIEIKKGPKHLFSL